MAKIGIKNPPINDLSLHRWKVIDRKREIELARLDAEQTEVYTQYKSGTHQSNFWQDLIDGVKREGKLSIKIGNWLKQLLP